MVLEYKDLSRRGVLRFLVGASSTLYFGFKTSSSSAKLLSSEDSLPPSDPTKIPGLTGIEENKAALEGGGYAWSRQRAMQFGEVCRTTFGGEDAVLLTGENGIRAFYNSDYVSREQAKTAADLAFLSDGRTKVVPAMDGPAFIKRKSNLMTLVSKEHLSNTYPKSMQ
jgi:hypothetical protein